VCGGTPEAGEHETCVAIYVASMHATDRGLARAPAVPLALEDVGCGFELSSIEIRPPEEHVTALLHVETPFKVPIA